MPHPLAGPPGGRRRRAECRGALITDAPRPGPPARITDEHVCRIVALACEAPERAGRPISQWTARELAEEIQQRGIVEQISARHAARLLKRGRCNRTGCDTG